MCYFFFSEEPFLLKQTFQYLGYYQIEGSLCGETRQLSVSLLNLSIPSLSRDFRLVSDRRYFFSLVSLFFIRSWSLRHHLYMCRSKHWKNVHYAKERATDQLTQTELTVMFDIYIIEGNVNETRQSSFFMFLFYVFVSLCFCCPVKKNWQNTKAVVCAHKTNQVISFAECI